MKSFFPGVRKFSTSDNNKAGKDLFEEISGTHVELKSGKLKTDGNCGLSTISWAIEDQESALREIFVSGTQKRRELALTGGSLAEVEVSKKETMDTLHNFFVSRLALGPASPKFGHLFKCVASGFTKLPEIVSSFESPGVNKTPLMLEADWEQGLVLYNKLFLPDESIQIVEIERKPLRFQITVAGAITGRSGRLYPNFKNSWAAPDHRKVPANYWAKSGSFHVWISG